MLEIFKTRKAMKAEIEDLKQQLAIQSKAMEKLRLVNIHLDRLYKEAEDECKQKNEELENAKSVEANLTGENMSLRKKINALEDTNSGLASSVSELKSKLKSKDAKLKSANKPLARLKTELEKRMQIKY